MVSGMEVTGKVDVEWQCGWLWVANRGREVIHEECAPVFRKSVMDEEEQGCGMLVDRMLCWLENLTRHQLALFGYQSSPCWVPLRL